MKKKKLLVFMLLIVLAGCGGQSKESGASKDRITVYTTFYPTYEFTRIIGGSLVKVVNPLPEDEDPIFWMPSRKVIDGYQKADLIVINGAEFEKWVKKVILPDDRIVNTAKPFEDNLITIKGTITHSHGMEGKHAHEGIDGHTWLDPVLAKVQAGEIRNALIAGDPANEKVYRENYDKLSAKLDRLDNMFKELSGRYANQVFAASHPAYNYLARRYGWKVKSFDFDPGEIPSGHSAKHFREFIRKNPVKALIWESRPDREVEEYFTGNFSIKSLEFSPVENLSKEDIRNGRDYFTVMEQNIRNISVLF